MASQEAWKRIAHSYPCLNLGQWTQLKTSDEAQGPQRTGHNKRASMSSSPKGKGFMFPLPTRRASRQHELSKKAHGNENILKTILELGNDMKALLKRFDCVEETLGKLAAHLYGHEDLSDDHHDGHHDDLEHGHSHGYNDLSDDHHDSHHDKLENDQSHGHDDLGDDHHSNRHDSDDNDNLENDHLHGLYDDLGDDHHDNHHYDYLYSYDHHYDDRDDLDRLHGHDDLSDDHDDSDDRGDLENDHLHGYNGLSDDHHDSHHDTLEEFLQTGPPKKRKTVRPKNST